MGGEVDWPGTQPGRFLRSTEWGGGMTELAQQEDRSLDVLDEYRSAIVDWANDAHHANRVAQSLANTTFVPQSMRGKPPRSPPRF